MPPFEIPSQGSFKRQIILTFVVGFFFLIAGFATYLVTTERDNLHRDSVNETTSMAQSLAASALPWVLANDVAGLQEVVRAFHAYPEFSYAMVISPTGKVLAHSDPTKIGLYVTDEQSLTLINAPHENRLMEDSESTMDVAVPIEIGERHVGWARVGSEKKENAESLRKMIWNNVIFLLFATTFSFMAAMLIANRLGQRIGSLVQVAEDVQAGNFDTRVSISSGRDEITMLGNSLNKMLDTLSQNEIDLRKASLYTRSLIEASVDPLVTISAEGKITDVNEATEKVTGSRRAELIGTDFSDYFTEPEKAREGYQQVFARGFVTDYPLAIRHRDGHITEILYNASVYRTGAGEVLGVFAAARDVTERNKAEAALRESESRFRLLVESSPMCIHEIGMDGRISSMNKAGLVMMGVEEERKVQGFLYLDAVTDTDRERIKELLTKAYAGEASYFEFKASGAGGQTYKSCFVPIKNPNGDVEKLMGITEDITEIKNAELRLQASEQLFRTLAENSPDVIVRYDREGRRIYVNPEFERVNHLSMQQVMGKTPLELSTELKPKADDFTEKLMSAMASGSVAKIDLSWVKDDKLICWFVRVVPEFDANGKVVSALTIWSDITERKRAEEEIKTLNQELEQRVVARTAELEAANKELESFSYSVSHDLRTPLRAIDGFSHILLEDYASKLDEEGKRLLNVVRGNTVRMGQLIDDILKFSRAGRLEMSFTEINMEGLVREIYEELRPPAAAGHGLQVEIGQLPSAMGDRAMMRQVFVNLLSNAIKFTRTREPAMIKVGAFTENNETVYFVQDNGAGFDMHYVDRLFGVFQRLHAESEFEGTGIGLAIVKRIIARHGGRVWAEGKVNEGATIYFALPAAKAASEG